MFVTKSYVRGKKVDAKKKSSSARTMAGHNRKAAAQSRRPAPFGRYEDKSPVPASRASKSAIAKAGAEGPKRSVAKKTTVKRKSPLITPAILIKKNGKMYGAKPMTLEEFRSPNRKIVPDLSKPLGQKKMPAKRPNTYSQRPMKRKK